MKNSNKLSDLNPIVAALAEELKARCALEGIRIGFSQTMRDIEYQNMLYAQGRTTPGKIVTNAKGGSSLHNYGVAFDVFPINDDGSADWKTEGEDLIIWQKIAAIGKEIGLEWGGDWKSFKDIPHFQLTQGLTLADFKAGKTIK